MADEIDVRIATATRHGLDPAIGSQLHGSTRAEWEADAAARSAIASLFGKPTEPTEPSEPAALDQLPVAELVERADALASELARRRDQSEEDAVGERLVAALSKQRHSSLVSAIHGEPDSPPVAESEPSHPDFDGGVRQPPPQPSNPEAEHGEVVLDIAAAWRGGR